jgi:GntR family transcriptional repressor for pyruvate dehydrogenase complex
MPIESVIDLAVLSGIMGRDEAVHDMFEFRNSAEGRIAALAAQHATREQVAELTALLEENAKAVAAGDRAAAQDIDVRFHAAVATASGNVVFQAVSASLTGMFVELRRLMGTAAGASEAAYAEHCAIVDAIARRDGLAATAAIEAHLRKTEARFQIKSREEEPAQLDGEGQEDRETENDPD